MSGPRAKSPRILRYRSQIKLAAWTLRVMLGFAIVEILFSQITNLTAILDGTPLNPLSPSDFILLGGMALGSIAERWLNQLSRTEIQAFSDHLLIRTGPRSEKVYYSDVQTLTGRSSPGLGGWIQILTKEGRTLRFTVVLERIDYILDAMIARRPDLLPENEAEKLRTYLILCDHNNARLYDFFSEERRLYTLLYLFGLPVFTVFYLGNEHHNQIRLWQLFPALMNSLMIVFAGALFLALPVVILSNWHLNRQFPHKTKRQTQNKMRDLRYERSIYRRLIPTIWLLAFLFVGVFAKSNLVALQRYAVFNSTLSDGVSSSTWVDIRSPVPAEMQVGRTIVLRTQERYLEGKIVAIPGDLATVHREAQGIRRIASNDSEPEAETIPENHLAVQIKGSEEVILIPHEAVVGRPLKDLSEFFTSQGLNELPILRSSNAQETDSL